MVIWQFGYRAPLNIHKFLMKDSVALYKISISGRLPTLEDVEFRESLRYNEFLSTRLLEIDTQEEDLDFEPQL
jgi:hypothetical protein